MPEGAGPQHRADIADAADAADTAADGRALAASLDLELLPLEGGLFRRTFSGRGASAILFMLIGDDFSAMHRLSNDEIYFHHAGSPLRMLLIEPDGKHREVIIGSDIRAGQHPQFHVQANWWQGCCPDTTAGGPAWSLVSTMVTPGFDWHDFTLGERDLLIALVTRHGDTRAVQRIKELTRPGPGI